MDAGETVIALVLANSVVALVCSFAAPRRWGWVLCMVALIFNAYPAFYALRQFLGVVLGRGGNLAGTALVLGLLLVLEELWLLYILRHFRRPQPPAG
jgi:hypothetical protein